MKTLTILPIIFLSLLAISCDPPSSLDPATSTEFVPGELNVIFTEDFTFQEANKFLQDLSLRPIDLTNLKDPESRNWAHIGVPVGEEKFWVKQLLHYQFIIFTERTTRKVPA